MRVYLLVLLIAAAVTYLVTPVARWVALRVGAITAVRDRDVHAVPTPRLGGIAMLAGLAVAFAVASQIPFLAGVFADSRQAWGILGAATMVCLLGVADDIWDLDWITKLVGQVLAAGFLAWSRVLLFQLPIGSALFASSDRTWLFLTVLTVVVAMNAVNFVDGLDGLAAGMIAIGGTAFFVYTYLLTREASPTDVSNLATLAMAALVGACLGFLPHNFYPARIFMGDSGSMLIGLVIAAATIVVTGQIDPAVVTARQTIPAFLPILLPIAVLLLPLLDMGLAVIRRVGAGRSPFHPDRMHLHHRLLALGHSHRRAVVIMYLWTAVFAFGAAALVLLPTTTVLWTLAAAAVVAVLLTLGPLRGRDRAGHLDEGNTP
ncbi:glycosyltransferase family 4 protein [Cellulomonas fimi]|uniref:Undecaprenyl/decaprenyl-phosphate alpha-N-acetylglucosaminyl 1-phosphate transferase n=1 Tax=Cellulomonas fimi TaxID=1708 RepID=A0A7Y0LX95_CELFI|nr:MraY family glycosyltransferase [Cellulomonas fimi]NMR19947.1 undecaprenyl/decaprenyl-phosphate alpha-N-acetylglucosaminyl 1-phosphate transferase [Cellulomonas fimi]